MTALAAAKSVTSRKGDVLGFPVKASTKCYQGGLAVLNGGYLAPGTAATGLIAVGMFQQTFDNSAGSNGTISGEAAQGTFLFNNSSAGDAITQAEVGADCYIVDDQTVAKTNGTNTRSRAGIITAVESTGVWVKIGLGV